MKRARVWLAVWAGWTAIALFFAVGNSLTYKSTGRPPYWTLTIRRSLAEYWLWALVTPAIVALARRVPLRGRRFWFHLALHVCSGAVFAFGKMMIDRAVLAALTGVWIYLLASTVAFNFAMYFGVVAAAHAVEFYRQSRDRDQLEARLAETRLQMLGMQLQPHFLFNTLNTIAELVHEDPDTADTMISHLSDLLRRTLELGSVQRITLVEELDLLSRYVAIQKARFGDRLQLTVSVDDSARGALVPPLLLQPIVENAIHHGLGARIDAGRVDIDVSVTGLRLAIAVTNDGGNAAAARRERIGLGNTRARLETLYGGLARLDLAPATGGGTRTIIELPFDAGEVVG
jgi:two-component system LytT family sensor kinase